MYFGPSQEKRFRLRICLAVLKFIKIRIDACLAVLQSASIHMDWEGLWWKKNQWTHRRRVTCTVVSSDEKQMIQLEHRVRQETECVMMSAFETMLGRGVPKLNGS